MKKQKSPLALKATSGAKFLKDKGHTVPVSLISEMLARLEGFGSYAAYLASLGNPAAATLAAPVELTHRLRLYHDVNVPSAKEWLIIPTEMTSFYEATSCEEILAAQRESNVFDGCIDGIDGLIVSLSEVTQDLVQLANIWYVTPSINRYGPPPMAWFGEAPFKAPEGASAAHYVEDIAEVLDLGDDSGSVVVVEIAVSEEVWNKAQDYQRSMFRATAMDIVGDIRSKARRHEFSVGNSLMSLVRSNYAGEFVDLPEFERQVLSV